MEENTHPYRKKKDWDQEDVLSYKDHVTTGSRGLQKWGTSPAGVEGQEGEASEGTAARSARIRRGQLGDEARDEESPPGE